ncbi:MAG: Phosphate transport system permease protein PstA [Candidatus Saccharicenans subterraneus]|uniref:Phosphate transport system permease protein PstA n=1 Tax=Candidatus Saccharicenans subterraneus TaxID=2508984 RepID=A0A3E2BMC6_9BACT|nr:MAG: Phosphate transport system permease protein PstA [Candidatus Saccharicenans subterraneum]
MGGHLRLQPRTEQRVVQFFMYLMTSIAVLVLVFILVVILKNGLPQLNLEFLTKNPADMGREGGILSTIVATIFLTFIALLVATPLGVGTAIYLTEYTVESRITRIIRFGAECLAGIPSIIFGLFGFILFVNKLKFGWSILSGGLTLAFMVLPTIIRTSEEAIKAVPSAYRLVSFSLGSTRWQTVTRVVLPSAIPGIVTGVILSIGRSIGETAAVIFTAGSALRMPTSLFSSSRTMSVHFYILAKEGVSMPKAYGTAAVLVISILVINIVTYYLMEKYIKRKS